MTLKETDIQFYHDNGYLVVENFWPASLCDFIVSYTKNLIASANFDTEQTIFSTKDQSHAKSRYFLESGESIRFFFEEAAFAEDGTLQQDFFESINKIGHGLHDLDPFFSVLCRSHQLKSVCDALKIKDPLLYQSMIICKQPKVGGEVALHQDSTYLFTSPEPVTGFWFALEDATLENGCLYVEPAGHHRGLQKRFCCIDNETYTETLLPETVTTTELQALPVKKGSLIILHGHLPHQSAANHSKNSRFAFTLHVGSANAHYAEDNWLQRQTPFQGF